jgi:hypothetical protein
MLTLEQNHFVIGPHAMDQKGLAHFLAEPDLALEDGCLHGHRDGTELVEPTLAHHPDLRMEESLAQKLPIGIGGLGGMPRVDAHGITLIPEGDELAGEGVEKRLGRGMMAVYVEDAGHRRQGTGS